ncbi:ion transporter [Alkalicoccus urumqiensis]|uniref:ion transporter n=1 Tax=Alkalicoccus urumqiensis TaxID=1548213 RepID=UPI001FE00E1D|nr:ion transporter [Alkalicoccus urumqiensis]
MVSNWKQSLNNIVTHTAFTSAVILLILFNAVLVGLETYPSIYEGRESFFQSLDRILLWIFTVEIAMRLLASSSLKSFFSSSWNWFDFCIVAAGHIFMGAHFVTVLRILRVIRVFRAVSVIPSLRRLVDALIMTIPSLGNIMLLMSIIFYIFAVIGTMLFQETSPEYFGTLELSLLTLFQVVTLESWASQVMRPIMEVHSFAWMYFVSFVLVGTFVIFNLFIGVIVSNVDKSEDHPPDEEAEALRREVEQTRNDIKELKDMIKKLQQ